MILENEYMGSPWERQSYDTKKSWAAFDVYLNLGRHRSIRGVAEKLGYRSTRWMEAWSSRYHWGERADAWDAHKAGIRRRKHEEAHAAELKQFLDEQKKLHGVAMKSAIGTFTQAIKQIEKLQKDDKFDPKNLPSLLRAAAAVAETASEAQANILGVNDILRLLSEED